MKFKQFGLKSAFFQKVTHKTGERWHNLKLELTSSCNKKHSTQSENIWTKNGNKKCLNDNVSQIWAFRKQI